MKLRHGLMVFGRVAPPPLLLWVPLLVALGCGSLTRANDDARSPDGHGEGAASDPLMDVPAHGADVAPEAAAETPADRALDMSVDHPADLMTEAPADVRADADAGSGGGSCLTESDCVRDPEYVGGCCGGCRVRTDPVPERVACIIPCQRPIAACACVNNRCTERYTIAAN
jgi:hypothetical protein